MSLNFRYPNITASSEKEQIVQIKSFLIQLVEQLNYELPTIGSADSSAQQAAGTKDTGIYSVQGEEVSYYELRSLIMQEIDKLDRLFEQLSSDISGTVKNAVETALEEAIESGEFTGPQGEPGADGVSVTHEWNGTVLTVTSASGSSAADLKGEKGDPGEQGPQGIQGEPGAGGADGYTPIKGEDYFTEEDKQEIITAVLAALAAGEQ